MANMFSRQADELILTMLDMRAEGIKLSEIARRLGVGKGKVIGAMRRIDEAEAEQ
jgi:transposase